MTAATGAPGDPVPSPRPVLGPATALAAVLAGVADAVAWGGWFDGRWSPGTAVALHAVVVAAVAGAAWRCAGRSDATALGLGFLAVSVGGLGPIGAVGLLAAAGLNAWFRRNAQPFHVWFESLFPDLTLAPEQILADRIRAGREDGAVQAGVAPFIDVLRLGTREQKEAVIGMLARHFTPAFAPVLRLALADETPSIRVQAATAAATIENGLMQTAMALAAAAQAAPGDAQAQLAVARHAEMHADLGILDPQQEGEMRRRAIEIHRQVLALDPGSEEARVGVGRGLVRLGRTEEAIGWLSDCFARGLVRLDLVDWYAECLFRVGDLDRLRGELRGLRAVIEAAGPEERERAERLRFWLADAADAPARARNPETVA